MSIPTQQTRTIPNPSPGRTLAACATVCECRECEIPDCDEGVKQDSRLWGTERAYTVVGDRRAIHDSDGATLSRGTSSLGDPRNIDPIAKRRVARSWLAKRLSELADTQAALPSLRSE